MSLPQPNPENSALMAEHLERMLHSDHPQTALEAAKALKLLAEIDPERCAPLILIALKHPDHHVSQEAVRAVPALALADAERAHQLFADLFLGHIGDPKSFEPSDQLGFLCEIAPWAGGPILRDLLQKTENYTRNYAAYALKPLADSDPAFAAQLIDSALKDEDDDIRQKAAHALQTLAEADPERAKPLIERALADHAEAVQLEAKRAREIAASKTN